MTTRVRHTRIVDRRCRCGPRRRTSSARRSGSAPRPQHRRPRRPPRPTCTTSFRSCWRTRRRRPRSRARAPSSIRLADQGVFVPRYFATGHASLDNYLAMISGQAQYFSTSIDCPIYKNASGTINPRGYYHAGPAARHRLCLPGRDQDASRPAHRRGARPGRATWRTWATRATARHHRAGSPPSPVSR